LRYLAATRRANLPPKKSSHPRGSQQFTIRIIGICARGAVAVR
jgi:hypothetical protein